MKNIFICVGAIGISIISFLAFTVPKDPYQIIPPLTIVSFSKPIWVCYMFGGSFLYIAILYSVYDKLKQRKTV